MCAYTQIHLSTGVRSRILLQRVRLPPSLLTHHLPTQSLATSYISYNLGTGFSTLFPGLNPHLLTLATNFRVPLYRDILLALGICSVSKASCASILRAGKGMSCVIVVGGAAEVSVVSFMAFSLLLLLFFEVFTFCTNVFIIRAFVLALERMI